MQRKYIDHSLQLFSPAGERLKEMVSDRVLSTFDQIQNIDLSNESVDGAYDSIKQVMYICQMSQLFFSYYAQVLKSSNYWDNLRTTCGLEQVRHRGKVAWIAKDPHVKNDFIVACNKQK